MCSCSLSWPGKFGLDSDHVTLSARGGLDRVPFLLGDDRKEVLDPDGLGARNVFDRALVDLDRHSAGDSRADHARMQHSRKPHVVDHLQRAEDLARANPGAGAIGR